MTMFSFISLPNQIQGTKKKTFSMAIENLKLLQECCPQHLRMGTAGMKRNEVTYDESRQLMNREYGKN